MARREFSLYTSCPHCGHRYRLKVEVLILTDTLGPSARTITEPMFVLCHVDARVFGVRVPVALAKGESVVRVACLERTPDAAVTD